ncbi:hypothetical protein GBA52_001080 [Prunus armeniaca]|nr:hypothetical protein GBA52_001080 [Prunus armeniaca]
MEGVTEGVNNLQITDSSYNKQEESHPSLKYQKAPLLLCQSCQAIATVVTIAEILKNNGLAFEKKITTSTIDMREDAGGRPIQKAKIEILLGKSEVLAEIMAADAAAAAVAAEEALEYEQS